ncbi:hypothetical protein OG978_03460 [Streptomyces sp. NBC_01591]|uniref:hypothetical protein n=1 Tax=Streptomyces sp. NBC_01591 TaxID=2975888 RepID=UPI002DD88B0F|nr:hypothetical protein [Streptomyces sp. NBC_01591]WSD66521.1 hypothetical protein OG978_03460 [Streptomyces sp. NBC_01591]
MTDHQSFASTSLPRHLVRGALGFGALTGSVLLIPAVGPAGLLLAPVGLLALRGCPMCWTIGLLQTISKGRLRRSCVDGRCELSVAQHIRSHGDDIRQPRASEPHSVPRREPVAPGR